MMRVFVTGGTGFIGSYVLRELSKTDHEVRVLVRPKSGQKLAVSGQNLVPVEGDVLDLGSLRAGMKDCDAVIHLVGIIREYPSRGVTFEKLHTTATENVVEAGLACDTGTFVHMSANGARPDGISQYQTSKWAAQQAVEAAGFDHWTIFRPSIVFGKPDPGRPEFASDLVRQLVRPFPVLPVFGDGEYAMQPVSVTSLARAMVSALDPLRPSAIYEVAGPEALTYEEILDRLAIAMGSSPKPKIHVPVPLVSAGIAALGWTGLLPITADQLDMLLEGNTCDHKRFHEAFQLEPVPFNAESLSYLRRA